MGAVWLQARREARHRPLSFLGLALLVAVVAAVVLAGAAGAHRTASALDRFEASTNARDISGLALGPDLLTDTAATGRLRDDLLAVDGVEQVARGFGYNAVAGELSDFVLVSSPDGYFGSIDTPIIVQGRMPATDATDEVALTESASERLGLGPGDRLSAATFAPESIVAMFEGDGFPTGPDGPQLDLDVVGVVRTGEELSGTDDIVNPLGIMSPAFATSVDGRAGRGVIALAIKAEPETDIAAVQAVLTEHVGPGWESIALPIEDDFAGQVGRSYRTLAIGVAIFTLIAGAAGILAIGQAIGRQNLLRMPDDTVARALGATPSERAVAVCLPSLVAVAIGVAIGIGAAIAASPLFPVSVARRAETEPGVLVDPVALGLGALVILAVLGSWAWIAARRSVRRVVTPARVRPARTVAAVATLGGRPAMVVGLRLATERGSGRTAVPARSAVVGSAVAVAGIIGVAVFLVTLDDARSDPARYGWAWSTVPDVPSQDPAAVAAAVAEDDQVASAGRLIGGTVAVDGTTMYAHALDVLKGSMVLTLLDGRLPSGDGEVALGQRTLDDLELHIGDDVEIAGPGEEPQPFVVVGAIVPPLVDGADPGRGATFTEDGLAAARTETFSDYLVLQYAPGVDAVALEDRLAADHGLEFSNANPNPPGQLNQLDGMRATFVALAIFLGLVGIVGLLQFLAVSVRRRRSQFAVLRALGFVRSQMRHAVSWQAVAATAAGVLIGIPLGVIAGRAAWLLAVNDLGMVDTPSTPWLIGAAVVTASLLGAALIATGPGWYAASRPPAELLRSE